MAEKEDISKRFAEILKSKKSANNGIQSRDNKISDLANRPLSIEQNRELATASKAEKKQGQQRVDNFQTKKPIDRNVSSDNNLNSFNNSEQLQDYSLPPISYARSQIGNDIQENNSESTELSSQPEKNKLLGESENKALQKESGSVYRPEGLGDAPQTMTPDKKEQLPVSQPEDGDKRTAETNAKSRFKDLGKSAKETAKKLFSAIKKIPPVAWPWIILALAILFAIIIIAVAVSLSGESSPAEDGKPPPIQTDPVADKEWVRKVLALTGDTDVVNAMTAEFLAKLKNDLEASRIQINSNADISQEMKTQAMAKIDEILPKIEAAKGDQAQRKTLATEIKTKIEELANLFYANPVFPGEITTAYPLKQLIKSVDSADPNRHPHIGTPGWPCSKGTSECKQKKENSDWPARTYKYSEKNICDAVDFDVPAKDPVYAAFGGEIMHNAPNWGIWVETTVNNIKYSATYAHVDLLPDLKVGSKITAGEQLGTIQESTKFAPRLHFELEINGKCVVNTPAEVIAAKNNNYSPPLGKTLWQKMATALHLTLK